MICSQCLILTQRHAVSAWRTARLCLALQFSCQMFYGSNGVMPNHSRSCPSHYFTHPFFHFRTVAVNGAFSARHLPVVQAVCQCAKVVDDVVRDNQFFRCKIRHRLWEMKWKLLKYSLFQYYNVPLLPFIVCRRRFFYVMFSLCMTFGCVSV